MPRPTAQQLTDAYYEMQQRLLNAGFEPYILTLMFNHLPGNAKAVARMMELETERTYARLLTRIIKKPAITITECMPLLLACPDWPVPKSAKMGTMDACVNDGRHIHGMFLLPPQSRLKSGLDEMLRQKQEQFSGPGKLLARLHAEPVTRTPDKASSYVLKSLSRGRVDLDGIIILPRSHSEMTRGN